MNRISSNYEENTRFFDDALGAGRSCDMVCREPVRGRPAGPALGGGRLRQRQHP